VQKDVTVVKLNFFIPPFGTKKNHRFYPDNPATESGSPNGGISGGRVGRCGQDELTIWPAFADAISDLNKSGN
jgi:hypothetical protein